MLLLAGRSRGWRVGHSLHFALQEPGDREAGGGARAPKAAAKRLPLRRRRLSAVAPLPCPSPRHRPLVRAFSANGAGRVRRLAVSGRKSAPRRPLEYDPGATPDPRGRGFLVNATVRFKPSVSDGPDPLFRSNASFAGADVPVRGRTNFHGAMRPWISISCPRDAAETDHVWDFC
jgi:hypothetical protein